MKVKKLPLLGSASMAVALHCGLSHADAVPFTIGNGLTSRAYPSDIARDVLVVNVHDPVPFAGFIDTFQSFIQSGQPGVAWKTAGSASGYSYQAYILRPVSGNPHEYEVLFDSGPRWVTGPENSIFSFKVNPIAVQPGDVIASLGRGIPVDPGNVRLGADVTYYPLSVFPVAGETILLNQISTTDRTLSFAALGYSVDQPPNRVPEAGMTLSLLGLGICGMGIIRRKL